MNEMSLQDMSKLTELHQALEQHQIKGFLAQDEAEALYQYALHSSSLGPCLEIGSYCGKSSVYLGSACRAQDNILFTIDHHRGSEEHQTGEEYHDPDLFDRNAGRVDTFPALRKTLDLFSLQQTVVPIVAPSQVVAKKWAMPLGLVFVDGGHSLEQALFDCLTWSEFVVPGGYLLIHDIFPNPADGGQAPYLALQETLKKQTFSWVGTVRSLAILQRR